MEIDQNLFDFDVQKDGGNLVSGFGKAAAKGPASFHDNLVNTPGRGVIWINEIFNNLEIRNNHIITRTTVTPRLDGLSGFNPGCDFKTITIQNNLIECQGQARPVLRCKSIRLLGSHGHDVVVFQPRDASEVEFPFDTAPVFRDLETGEELEVDPAAVRESYLQNLAAESERFRKGLLEVGIDYVPLNTREPSDKAFSADQNRRSKLRG